MLVAEFIAHPYPLWSDVVAEGLVVNYLKSQENPYSLTSCILKAVATDKIIDSGPVPIVIPSEKISFFFEEHGLVPFPEDQLLSDAAPQINSALDLLNDNPLIQSFMGWILKSIVVIKAEHPEIDVSYSHPAIPFSIFVSVCDNPTLKNTFRVTESILHESMHLYLTLIEGVIPVIQQGTTETFFSPWRDENRPVRGVLHGLFVFKAVLDFYREIQNDFTDADIVKFIDNRIFSISGELNQIMGFQNSLGLTADGQKLSSNLLLHHR
jgi:hypothetical protein